MSNITKEQLIKAFELYLGDDLNNFCDPMYKKENEQTSLYIKDEIALDYLLNSLNKVPDKQEESKLNKAIIMLENISTYTCMIDKDPVAQVQTIYEWSSNILDELNGSVDCVKQEEFKVGDVS